MPYYSCREPAVVPSSRTPERRRTPDAFRAGCQRLTAIYKSAHASCATVSRRESHPLQDRHNSTRARPIHRSAGPCEPRFESGRVSHHPHDALGQSQAVDARAIFLPRRRGITHDTPVWPAAPNDRNGSLRTCANGIGAIARGLRFRISNRRLHCTRIPTRQNSRLHVVDHRDEVEYW
jgi:hypothetical protein